MEAAVRAARQALGLPETVEARVWPVYRAAAEPAYFLVVFGTADAAEAVAAVDAATGQTLVSARLPGTGGHRLLDAAQAARAAGADPAAPARLVWQPSRASMSPLYPLWEVTTGEGVRYVDQRGTVWTHLEPGGPG